MNQIVEKSFSTEYGDIYYRLCKCDAAQPWLIMLPGLTADHHLFDKQFQGLQGKYNCFSWDAPAHGNSRPFELKFTMWDMARWLHEIMLQEGITNPVLIGQSLGGYISQVFMEMYPDLTAGFISIDSCSLKRKYYTKWELALLKRTKWMYMSIPWKLLLEWGIAGTSVTEYGRSLMRKIWSVYTKEEFCELSDHGFRIFAEAVEAGKHYDITCPVLLLCGEKDMAGSAKSYNKRWTAQDGYPLIWLKDAGHNANTDVPERVNQLIDEFVKKIDFYK